MSAGCVNRRLFAYMFALTTLSGDNMSVLFLQLIPVPTIDSIIAALEIIHLPSSPISTEQLREEQQII